MTLANTQVRTLAAQRFEIMGVVGLLVSPQSCRPSSSWRFSYYSITPPEPRQQPRISNYAHDG